MKEWQRGLLLVAIVLLGAGEVLWKIQGVDHQLGLRVVANRAQRDVAERNASTVLPKAHEFTRPETYAFLDAAKQAESLADPLQRCLTYPDPPGSHWAHDVVVAYCNYRTQPVPTFAEVDALIRGGKAAEVDRRFAQLLQAQLTDAHAHGRLDRAFYEDFQDGSFAPRPTLDAWKRASPHSAFAFAASGYAYVQMAATARGNRYASETSQGKLDAMQKLLAQADTDLRQAIALDPRLTPAYTAMIRAGGLSLGRDYALDAGKRGLAVAPDNNAIYGMLMWLQQPKWGGSLQAMDQLAQQAQAHAAANPLLNMLLTERPLYQVQNCDCDDSVQLAAYPAALDQLPLSGYLYQAGDAAGDNHFSMSAIYLSEALRFNPGLDDARRQRIADLIEFDEADWGVAEATRLIQAEPNDASRYLLRAQNYQGQGDYPHAEQDLDKTLQLAPGNPEATYNLAWICVYQTHEWDRGWALADQLIKSHPEEGYGWTLRADIQHDQPRAGFKDTVDYFAAHFGKDERWREIALRMQASLAMQRHSGKAIEAKPPQRI
jgi:predicted Zn-dependent protease